MIERMGAIYVPLTSKGFRRVPGLKKVDLVIDTVGGSVLQLCCDYLHPSRGRLISVGMVSNVNTPGVFGMPFSVFVDKVSAYWKTEDLYKYDLFNNWKIKKDQMKSDIEFLFHLLEARKIQPKISKVVSLQGVADAHEQIELGGLEGHIVCDPWKKIRKNSRRMISVTPRRQKLKINEIMSKKLSGSGLTNQLL